MVGPAARTGCVLSALLAMTACGGPGEPQAGDQESGHQETKVDPYAISWQETGDIDPTTNVFGVEGSFYFATDCESAAIANLPCTVLDTGLLGGDGQYGWTVNESRACARGVAPQVMGDPSTGDPTYDQQWGALLGIELHDPDRDVFDANAHGIVGFKVDIAGTAPSDLRVNLLSPETVEAPHFVTPRVPSRDALIRIGQAAHDYSVPLDFSRLGAVEFQVYTNASAAKPFDFCISNLRAILE
jgi:hypothetical protein